MLVVHHLENSRSQRVLWLLEELGLDYEVKRYDRDKTTNLAPKELKAVHPLGKSPVLEDGGAIIAETGAMIDYLLDRHGNGALRPAAGGADYERYRYWLHYAEGSAFPPLLLKLILTRMATAPMPFFAKPIAKSITKAAADRFVDPQLALHFNYIESELGRSTWFAGAEFSGADVIMSFPLEAYASRGDISNMPNISNFLERIHARPAYKRALERGGPYTILR